MLIKGISLIEVPITRIRNSSGKERRGEFYKLIFFRFQFYTLIFHFIEYLLEK